MELTQQEQAQKDEEELKAFMLNVGEHLKQLFPKVGFSLTIFDHFSEEVLSYITNSDQDLTKIFETMIAYSKTNPKTVRNPTIGNA